MQMQMQMQMQLGYQRELDVLLMRRTLPNAFHANPYAKSQPAANACTNSSNHQPNAQGITEIPLSNPFLYPSLYLGFLSFSCGCSCPF